MSDPRTDAIDRLERLIRDNMAWPAKDKALSLISEAREEQRKAAVLAKNRALETVRTEARRQANEYAALLSETARDRHMLLLDFAADIADLKDPEP